MDAQLDRGLIILQPRLNKLIARFETGDFNTGAALVTSLGRLVTYVALGTAAGDLTAASMVRHGRTGVHECAGGGHGG